jgi:hypothetical protein
MASPQGWLPYCHYHHLTWINDGHPPSGVDSVLLPFTPVKPGLVALLPLSSPGGTGVAGKATLKTEVHCHY